jgi:hypothetical protein
MYIVQYFPCHRLALTEVFSSPKSHYTFYWKNILAKMIKEYLKPFSMLSYGKEILGKVSVSFARDYEKVY